LHLNIKHVYKMLSSRDKGYDPRMIPGLIQLNPYEPSGYTLGTDRGSLAVIPGLMQGLWP
jgi:hypothetical protein